MPSNPLKIHEPLTFVPWLQNELHINSSIVPHQNHIPDNLIGIKGIYFWFMKSSGYHDLSNYINISVIDPVYKKIIEEEEYDLVYLGTAGMGKNGGSDLFERLKWHIENKHTSSSVCSGALSTLRQGLGALLSDDLILPNTEELVNKFMQSSLHVFWVSYEGKEDLINEDEIALIQNLKPLLNIRNNPNAKAIASANPTKDYKLRRVSVIASTRNRLYCGNEAESKMSKVNPPLDINFRYKEQIVSAKGECIEFSVYKHQSIAQVVRGIPGLPTGKVNIMMCDAANTNHQIFPGWKKTGGGKQNIYTYFSNVSGNSYRHNLIKEYMAQNNIDEIMVKVSSDDNNSTTSSSLVVKPEPIKPMPTETVNQEPLKLSEPFKVVMVCSSRKQPGTLNYNGNAIKFLAKPNHANNEYLPDDLVPGDSLTWRKFVLNNQHPAILPYPAYKLYKAIEYTMLYNQFVNNLYILSAGWGLVKAEFRLPQYDITFSTGTNVPDNTRRTFGIPGYSDFNQLIVNEDDDIVFIGGPLYLDLFFALTAPLPNRKIVYYRKANLPHKKQLPNTTFIYRYYNTARSTNWYYDLAHDLANGIIP